MRAPQATVHGHPPRPGAERRLIADRRTRPTPLVASLRPGGRRARFRRAGEGRNAYQDHVGRRIAVLAFLIVIFSALDALFTLLHLEAGAQEANPVMRLALLAGLPVFLAIKTVGTGAGTVFLAIHQNFRLSWLALHAVAIAYGALLGYHVGLFLD